MTGPDETVVRMQMTRWMRGGLVLAVLLIALVGLPGATAQDTVTITVQEGQTLREIAAEYLDDPNLWVEILRANDLASPADVIPGMRLAIPANKVSLANQMLAASLAKREEATFNGARLFAPELIQQAIDTHDQAMAARKAGDWDRCRNLAAQAEVYASEALDICIDNQNVPAQAIVNYRSGGVQARGPESRAWITARKHHVLLEGDRVRTLSESMAGIFFRDESRLRLEENSLALIQKMRYNNLENVEESSVSLLEGDIFAFLGGGRSEEDFDLEIEGVETAINSSQFWVSKDEDAARFANYDGQIDVTAGGQTVQVKANQGSIVSGGRAELISELLPKPDLVSPPVFARLPGDRFELEWEPVEGAVRYWLEIAHDKAFNSVFISSDDITRTRFVQEDAPREVYYWRVAAVDRYGLPGPKSEVRLVAILADDVSPYLLVTSPPRNSFTKQGSVEVSGETERGALVTVNGEPVSVGGDGQWSVTYNLVPGKNVFEVVATDDAGNETGYTHDIVYLPTSERGSMAFDASLVSGGDNRFIVQPGGFTLAGISQRLNRIDVASMQAPFRASTRADDAGRFSLNVPLTYQREDFELSETTPTGDVSVDTFAVEVDTDQPEIQLATPVPHVTGNADLHLEGWVRDGRWFWINGAEVVLGDRGAFAVDIPLELGENRLRLEARDEVRNLTILERTVTRDADPPTLTLIDITPTRVTDGGRVYVRVQAEDPSGLVRAAPFTLAVGEFSYDGLLVLSRGDGTYNGAVAIPPGTSGRVTLQSLILEDYFGNRADVAP